MTSRWFCPRKDGTHEPGCAQRDEPAQSLAEMRSYGGKFVRITLDYDDPAAQVTGHLLYITDDGEVAYISEGKRHYGWPCLAVTGGWRPNPTEATAQSAPEASS